MRLAPRVLTAAIALLAALSLAGCVSSSTAGWTFAPPPSATAAPAASAGASGSPAASAAPAPGTSAAPSAAPSVVASPSPAPTDTAAPSASPAASGGSADVTISASNIAFEQSSVDAPAGRPFTLLFDNKDASVQHDVFIKDGGGNDVFQGAIVTGPAQMTYNVTSLAAGTYTFYCSIHSNMTGTFNVK